MPIYTPFPCRGFVFAVLSLFHFAVFAQPVNKFSGDVTMPAPNAASLGRYGDVPVSYFTGVPNISIPIHTVQSGPLSLPVSLSYHAGGIRVGEPVSWVGTGWSLNAGGIITRTILGLPDECGVGYKYKAPTLLDPVQTWVDLNNYFNNWNVGTNECPSQYTSSLCSLAWNLSTQLQNANNGQLDTEPDLFTFNVGGYAGKFIMDKDGKLHLIPKSDVKIEYTADPNSSSEWWITQFILTVPDGTRYIFGRLNGETGRTGLEFNQFDSPPYTTSVAPASWYLRKVETHDGKFSIALNYTAENYSYLSLASYTYTYVNAGSSSASTGLVSVAPPYKYANRSNITGWRLTDITSPTETVTFIANTDRTDLDQCYYSPGQFPTSKRALDSIKVTSGTFCKRFVFQYSYFQDNTNTTPSYSKRLRLNSLTEMSCDGTITIPAHQFSYKPGNLINRLSHQIDHWGYFNGKTSNETTSNIPPVSFVDFSGQLFSPPFATADRSTSEADMLTGMIDTIKYPTGGFTKFTFEANTAMLPAGWTGNGNNNNTNCSTQIVSQAPSNCTYPSATCCPQSNVSLPDTFTSSDLDGAKIRMILMNLNVSPYQYCNVGNPNPPSARIRFTIKNVANGNTIFNHEFNLNTSQSEYTYETPAPYTLLPNVAYNLNLETKNGKGTAYLFKCGSSGGGGGGGSLVETKVGGLRIREIRTHDAVASANDIVRTYEYKNPTSPTGASSGVLYYSPQYVGRALRFDNFPLANIVTATSVVPLANFNGNHIAYPYVTELTNGNGKRLVTSISEQGYYANNKFPYGPDYACVKDGFEKEQRIFDQSNNVKSVSTKYPTTTDAYYNLAGARYKMSTYTVGGQTTGFFHSYSVATYPIRNAALRVSIVADTVDGVGTQTTYFYDNLNRFLAPTALETVNSDGKITRQENKYIHDYPVAGLRDSLLKRNLIAEPFVKTVKVNTLAVSGDSTVYAWFNGSTGTYQLTSSGGIPRPYKFFRYEMTWNNGTPSAGSRVLKGTIGNYNAQGKVASYTVANWPAAEYYSWSAAGLIQSRTYQSHVTSYDYYANTRLLRAITEIDGRKTGFVYDNLMRLAKSTTDSVSVNGSGVVQDGKVKTEYTYHFKETADPYNWVKTKTTFAAASGSGLTSTENIGYLDGTGRALQTVKKAWSPAQKDVVSAVMYDNQGRVVRQYTPFETASATGAFATVPANQPYTLTQYELSPLNRPVSVTPPAWYATTTSYGANGAGEVGYFDGSSPTSWYPAGSLSKTTVTTPQSANRSLENTSYKDKKGRVILSRRREVESPANVADTYTFYDDKDRVTRILPPGVSTAGSEINLRFEYNYDAADRMTYKKVPDMAGITLKYNSRDLLVLTQDGNLAPANKWLLTKYDDYGRPVSNGIHTGAGPDPDNATLVYSEQHTATIYGTSGINLGKTTQTQTWIPGMPATPVTRNFTYSAVTGRLLTDNGNNHLTGGTGSDNYTYTYDFAGNVLTQLRTHKTSAVATPFTLTTRSTYDHAGRKSTLYHQVNGNAEKQLAKYVYDYRDRLVEKNLDSVRVGATSSWLQRVDYAYNEQNWLKAINGGSSFSALSQAALATCSTPPPVPNPAEAAYAANPDGNDLFKLDLYYDSTGIAFGGPLGQRNGNIAQLIWQTRGRQRQGYSLQYDYLDRLTSAYYADIDNNNIPTTDNKFQEDISYYDARGNIYTITRKGMYKDPAGAACYTNGTIDVLGFAYNYASNTIQKITESATGNVAKYQGFNPGSAGSGAAYTYDANGNLKTDPYKGITDIKYNHLNLPTLINFGSSGKDSLLYDFAGKKLAKLVLPTTTAGYTQNYVDGIEYRTEGGTSTLNLEAIYHPEGRITPNGAVYQYEYSIKDHLGNTRLTFADLNANSIVDVPGDILQENHYYPFGLNMNYGWLNATALDNRYQYNGKEWNDDFGLNWNDYGARWYDAAVGRWWSVDLLAEKYPNWSSYIYAVDNPIIFIDPDGKDIIISIKGRGENVDAKRQEHLSQLQRLTNDKLTMGEDGKVNIATKATGRLSDLSKAGGTMLIRNLINGIEQEDGTVKNFTVTIVEGINNGIDPVNSNGVTTDESVENSENGTGTGSKITFNINKKGDNVVNADNTTGRPPRIGLAHELVHAKNNMMGANKRSTITDTNDPDTSRNGNVEKMSQEEINVRTEENIIRKEQKVKPRQLGGQ